MNYLGKRVIILLATPLLLWAPAFGMLNNIKGTYDILNNDYKHFSLVHGAIQWETGVIRRLYDFGQIFPEYKEENGRKLIWKYTNLENTHKTVQLIHALFYRVPGSTSESDFSETKLLNIKDASAIAQKVAAILALIRTLRQQNTKVKDILGTAKTLAQEQLDDVNTKLQDLDKKLEPVPKKQWGPILKAASDDETKWVKERSELRKNIGFIAAFQQEPTVEQNYKNLGKAIDNSGPITELYKNLEQLQRLFTDLLAQSPLDLTRPSIAQVAFDAINESDLTNVDALYPEHMPEMILLAFVYKRCSEDRSALKALYEKLNELLRLKVLKQELTDTWVKDSFDVVSQDTALTNLQEIFDLGEQENINKMDAVLYYALQIRSMPAPVGYAKATYEYQPGKKTASFPDCMCNTMRNLINTLVYDAKNNNFDLAILKKRLERVSDQFDAKLEKFFKDFSSIAKASSSSAHDAWAGVISNIPYVAYVRSSGSLGEVKGLGYISIPTDDLTNTALVDFLKEKGYQVLSDNHYGYELMPSVRNVIVVLNHLLKLNLFENGLVNDFTNVEFIKTYFPKLWQGLKVKAGYQALTKEASKQDTQTDFDKRDFEPEKVYSSFAFLNPQFTCELMTRNLNHGELYLRGASEKEEAKMIELIKNRASKIKNTSLSFIVTNLLCRQDVNLEHLFEYSRQPQVVYCNLFAVLLENTGFLENIIDQDIFYAIDIDQSSLKIKLNTKNLLLRLAEKQPDERERKLKKLKIFRNFVNSLGNVEITECEKNQEIAKVIKVATECIKSSEPDSIRLEGFNLFEELVTKDQAFDQAAVAAENARDSDNPGVLVGGLKLSQALVKAGHLFDKKSTEAEEKAIDKAAEVASRAMKSYDSNILDNGLELFRILIEKGAALDKATESAAAAMTSNNFLDSLHGLSLVKILIEKDVALDKAAEAVAKAMELDNSIISDKGLELLQILIEKGAVLDKVAETAAIMVGSKDSSISDKGLELLHIVIEKGAGLDKVTEVATKMVGSYNSSISDKGLELLHIVIKKGAALDKVTEVATRMVGSKDSAISKIGQKLFKALVEEGCSLDEAAEAAAKAMESNVWDVLDWVEELFGALFKRGYGFDKAAEAASKAMQSSQAEIRYEGEKLFGALFKNGYGFDKAKEVAVEATESADWGISYAGQILFKILIEKGYGFDEAADAASKKLTSGSLSKQKDGLKLFDLLKTKAPEKTQAAIQKLLLLSTIDNDTKEKLREISEYIEQNKPKTGLLQEKLTTLKSSLTKLKEKLESLRSSLINLKKALAKS